jgi:hypothetical protein
MGGPIEGLLYELDSGIGGHSCEFFLLIMMRMTSYLGTWRFYLTIIHSDFPFLRVCWYELDLLVSGSSLRICYAKQSESTLIPYYHLIPGRSSSNDAKCKSVEIPPASLRPSSRPIDDKIIHVYLDPVSQTYPAPEELADS